MEGIRALMKPTIIKEKMVRLFVLLWGCFGMLFFLSGCSKQLGSGGLKSQSSEPSEIMKQMIYERYNIEVDVGAVEEESGLQAFQESTWHSTATVIDSGEEFEVFLGKKSHALSDDYPKLIYDKEIRKLLDQVIDKQALLFTDPYEIIYQPSEGIWTREDQLEDYLTDSDTFVNIPVQLDDKENDPEKIYSLAEDLKEKGIQFTLIVEQGKDKYYISSNRYTKLKSKEAIIKMLKGR